MKLRGMYTFLTSGLKLLEQGEEVRRGVGIVLSHNATLQAWKKGGQQWRAVGSIG